MSCMRKQEDHEEELQSEEGKGKTESKKRHFEKFPEPGVNVDRRCRDILCLLLFAIFWGGMFIVAAYGIQMGDLARLQYGDDYLGNTCGKNNTGVAFIPEAYRRDWTNAPNVYILSPMEINSNVFMTPRICLPDCPNKTSLILNDMYCKYGEQKNISNVFKNCWPPYPSTSIFNRCVPTAIKDFASSLGTTVYDTVFNFDIVQTLISDIGASWRVIAACCAGSLVLGWIWLLLMRFFAGIMVWFTIFCAIFLLIGCTALMWYTGTHMQNDFIALPAQAQLLTAEISYKTILYSSYVLCGITAIFLLITVFNMTRIQLAVTVAEEASKAFQSMFLGILAFPLIPFFFLAVLVGGWVIISLLLVSAATAEYNAEGQFSGYVLNNTLKGMVLYLLFGFLWTMNWLLGIHDVTVAGAIADWYWSYSGEKLRNFPVARAFGRTLRYSMGSIAFASLILAIVQFIRIMLEYLRQTLKGKENKVARAILACMQCVMACFQRFIEFINKNAYVMIAIYGYSFCGGAKRGWEITTSNPLRIATLTCISNFCLFLGKIMITLATLGAAFLWLKTLPDLKFYYFPLIFIGIVAWVVASIIMSVYDMAIHTILFCFLEDSERNDGSAEKPYRMPQSLKIFMDNYTSGCCCCC